MPKIYGSGAKRACLDGESHHGQRTGAPNNKLSSRAQRGTCSSLPPASRVLPPASSRGARIALSCSVVRTKKDKGYLAEMSFVTKAMSLGFNVCQPIGATPCVDFVLEGCCL